MTLISETTNTARTTVVVSGSSFIAAIAGGVFALLVVVVLGQSEDSDAFLAAYSAYLLLLLFGSTMRVALIPQFGSTSDPEAFAATAQRRVGEVVPVGLMLGLIFVASSPLLGPVLMSGASDDAKRTASISIALLGIAAACQIWSAVLASVLGGARRFVASAVFYLIGSLAMLGIATVLMELEGVTGAAFGVLIAAVLLLLAHAIYLWRLGFPPPLHFRSVFTSHAWIATAKVSAAAVIPIVFQLNLTISIAFLSGGLPGTVSAYVYAYLATVTATGVTAAVITTVTLPNLISGLKSSGQAAVRPYLTETSAFGTYMFLPVALGFACFGWPVADAVLGGSMTFPVLDFFWDSARIFLIMGLIWAIFAPLISIALAQERYRLMAGTALVVIPLHVVLMLLLSDRGELGTTIGQAIAGSALSFVVLVGLFGRDSLSAAWDVLLANAPCVLLALVFVLPALLLDVSSLLASLGAIAICTTAYFVLGTLLWPSTGRRMVTLLLGRSARPAAPVPGH